MHFNRIQLMGWRQFSQIDVKLDSNVTIITGENGCGKTTLLNILAMHNNWHYAPLASPKEDKNGVWNFFTNISTKILNRVTQSHPFPGHNPHQNQNQYVAGTIEYSDSTKGEILIPENSGPQYGLTIQNTKQIPLLFIPSHRPIFKYQKIDNIPTIKKTTQQASEEVANSTRERFMSHHMGGQNQSSLMKNTLIGWAINGYGVRKGDQYIMPPDNEQISNFEGFQEILANLLPKTLGFEKIEIRNMEIVLICHKNVDDFMLESASGGVTAIIDLAWQVFMFSKHQKDTFCVLIDEVENHLHPKMQRRVLPDLVAAFPKAKFIVSTHSPLIVNSVLDANVYVFIHDGLKFSSSQLDLRTSALEANEILEKVLGVSSTLSISIESSLQKVIESFKGREIDDQMITEFRNQLSEIGMERILPKAIGGLIK